MLKALNLEKELGQRHLWNNKNKPSEMTEEELTKLYFKQLDMEDIEKLYEIYEMDFKLFGYSFQYKNMTFPR